MMLLTAYYAHKRKFPRDQPFAWSRFGTAFREAAWALFMPVLVLGGFGMGVCTATEIAGIAAAYSLIVGMFVYRTLTWPQIPKMLLQTAKETAVILLIVAAASPFSWFLGVEQAPQLVLNLITQATDKPWVVLLLLNVVLLILGCFMETIAIMIILVPILIPVLGQYHVDLTHFGIVLLINLTIGQLTPPVGVLLFVSSSITKVPFRVIAREYRRAGNRFDGAHVRPRGVAVAAGGDIQIAKGNTLLQAILQKPKTISFLAVPIPEPGEGQALIEVKRIGICGSDIHV
jgi:tripartite ATP-independent transporter DctM subunit